MTKSAEAWYAGTAWRAWHGSGRWQRRRALQLREHPLCCLGPQRGHVAVATVADYIEPHRGDWNVFLTGPLQSLCVECHNGSKERGYALDVGIDGWPLDPRHPTNRRRYVGRPPGETHSCFGYEL